LPIKVEESRSVAFYCFVHFNIISISLDQKEEVQQQVEEKSGIGV
jgi:hypothetical protein